MMWIWCNIDHYYILLWYLLKIDIFIRSKYISYEKLEDEQCSWMAYIKYSSSYTLASNKTSDATSMASNYLVQQYFHYLPII